MKHVWRTGCHDSPPGKMMRLLGVLELDEFDERAKVAVEKARAAKEAAPTGGEMLNPPPMPVT